MTLHLRHSVNGHSHIFVSHLLLLGRTGFWRINPEVASQHVFVYLWEFKPNNGVSDKPYRAKAKITRVYSVEWLNDRRSIVEFDPATLVIEEIDETITIPSFNQGGICYTIDHTYPTPSPAPVTSTNSLVEHLTKANDSLGFAISDIRQALPHCRGPLTTSNLLLMKDLETAVALQQCIENHLIALLRPMMDETISPSDT